MRFEDIFIKSQFRQRLKQDGAIAVFHGAGLVRLFIENRALLGDHSLDVFGDLVGFPAAQVIRAAGSAAARALQDKLAGFIAFFCFQQLDCDGGQGRRLVAKGFHVLVEDNFKVFDRTAFVARQDPGE